MVWRQRTRQSRLDSDQTLERLASPATRRARRSALRSQYRARPPRRASHDRAGHRAPARSAGANPERERRRRTRALHPERERRTRTRRERPRVLGPGDGRGLSRVPLLPEPSPPHGRGARPRPARASRRGDALQHRAVPLAGHLPAHGVLVDAPHGFRSRRRGGRGGLLEPAGDELPLRVRLRKLSLARARPLHPDLGDAPLLHRAREPVAAGPVWDGLPLDGRHPRHARALTSALRVHDGRHHRAAVPLGRDESERAHPHRPADGGGWDRPRDHVMDVASVHPRARLPQREPLPAAGEVRLVRGADDPWLALHRRAHRSRPSSCARGAARPRRWLRVGYARD